MPEPIDHIAFLTQDVGARPAGTEEEQKAALYIAEQFQKGAGLPAEIEDFSCQSNAELPRALCVAATLILTIAALIFPAMMIPAIIVSLLAAVLYGAETLGKPILSSFFTRGVSQNIVAKYEPRQRSGGGARRRKVIVVANYDSGKTRAELKRPFLDILPLLQKISLVAMALVPLILVVWSFFFLHDTGAASLVLKVILILALLLSSIPLLLAILHFFSSYNEAANSNGSGVAALLELARRIGSTRSVGAPKNKEATIHGEAAARTSGFVPEGAQLAYETKPALEPERIPQSEEDRLLAAKSAIAEMTGQKPPRAEYTSVADNLVQPKTKPVSVSEEAEVAQAQKDLQEGLTQRAPEDAGEIREDFFEEFSEAEEPGEEAESSASENEVRVLSSSSVPDWYTKAQENAKKSPVSGESKVVRSRYATALDAAVEESAGHFSTANSMINKETDERIKKMRDGIMEVSAPRRAKEEPETKKAESVEELIETVEKASYRPGTENKATKQENSSLRSEQNSQINLQETTEITPINVDELRTQREEEKTDSFSTKPVAPLAQETPITLPNISSSTAQFAPLDTSKQQRAPLAQAEESKQDAAKSLLNMLPSIDVSKQETESPQVSDARPGAFASHPKINTNLPSLSGEFRPVEETEAQDFSAEAPSSTGSVSFAGSFSSGATGTFAPVGDELLEGVAPEDVYIDDADDSVFEEGFTETGAFAGPGYVEMPNSRARRIFDRFSFRKKKKENEISAQQWLDVDEDFDAREIGKERGSWESFHQEEDSDSDFDFDQEFDQKRGEKAPRQKPQSSEDDWFGGAARSGREFKRDSISFAEDFEPSESTLVHGFSNRSEEIEEIHQFRGLSFDTEVWFVALGSELANNGGIHAFLNEHEQDTKGAIFINLESLGDGELSYLTKEGFTGKAGASSRMKRYIKKASQALGMSVGAASVLWRESASSVVFQKGLQAVTLAGMDGNKPAGFAEENDVLDSIDVQTLNDNIDFATELISTI